MKNSFTLILLLTLHTAFAQSISSAKEKAFAKRPLTFIENKGQVTDQYGNPRHDIQYKTGSAGMSVFIGNGQLHYQWSKALDENPKIKSQKSKPIPIATRTNSKSIPIAIGTNSLYDMYRLDMTLEGANPKAEIIPSEKQAYYENYHTTALHSDNATACSYNKITYKNIYPNIDWVLYISSPQGGGREGAGTLEYDFIVNPGGDINDIKIKYSGATDIAHTDGSIKVTSPFGNVSEQKLYAYEQNTNKQISTKYTYQNNTLGFSLLTANDHQLTTIIIDPELAWGTYFGGSGEDMGYGMTCDNAGNPFICGYTTSVSNIATIGAYQTVYGGNVDAFLAKFSSSGALLWATYYGGESQDYANGVACDNAGNAYITGFTLSTHDIATGGSYQTVLTGTVGNGFLTKFSDAGALQWATYYNGEGRSLTCDANGNVYLAGGTTISNAVATAGSYQDTLSGTGNACLAKFNGSGTIIWATYFGLSTGASSAYSCTVDKKNNVYLVGGVYDTGIITTPGCYKNSNGSGNHCFVTKFDSSCHLKWSTYFGGENGEYAYGIVSDDSSNVYITGLTGSTSGIASIGAQQPVYGGGGCDAFLAKFNDTGAMQWSTYYGGSGSDVGYDIAYDGVGSIYLTGNTNSPNNIATPNGYQPIDTNAADAFLGIFSTSGALIWGTYYGGDNANAGMGVGSDGMGGIYMAGYTSSPNNIATEGSYESAYMGGRDAFLVKFDTGTTGIKIVTQTIKELHLYPSPNNGNFIVSGEFENAINSVSITIINEEGQIIYSISAALQNGQLNNAISLQAAAGIYFVKVSIGNETKTIKFQIE